MVKDLAKRHGGTAASSTVGGVIVYILIQLFPNLGNATHAATLTKDDVKTVVTEVVSEKYATKEYVDRECTNMEKLITIKFEAIKEQLNTIQRSLERGRYHSDRGGNKVTVAGTEP